MLVFFELDAVSARIGKGRLIRATVPPSREPHRSKFCCVSKCFFRPTPSQNLCHHLNPLQLVSTHR